MDYQLTLNWPDFIERYWQKRPVVLKRGFANFIDPLSPDELAGLAMESEVDSRLVSHQDGKWQVSHGPFESYDHLSENNWSLLVQAVNHWHEPSAALMHPFRALPDWRIDDLMISFSVPGGGVGPHLDQYDVFIIQGTGRRRWRVGEKVPMKQHCPHPDLLQVDPFEAIIDEEMEPGDILYIPRDSRMRVIRWKTRLTIRSAIARRMPASCLAALPTMSSSANWAASATPIRTCRPATIRRIFYRPNSTACAR
ncbi:putative enzyme [Klebsiella pneumoniae]|nr:putative enzyme [Klebsiella pneumoniae]